MEGQGSIINLCIENINIKIKVDNNRKVFWEMECVSCLIDLDISYGWKMVMMDSFRCCCCVV